MSPVRLNNPSRLTTFGIEIAHSRSEATEIPPDQSARETIADLDAVGDIEGLAAIAESVAEINKIVLIGRETEDRVLGLLDLFTATQLKEMRDRIHNYLGKDIDSHLKDISAPTGYPFYIGRLAMHFASPNDDVTSQFGGFERRHTDPSAHATGPREYNSREYANWANEELLRQFVSFYQAEFKVVLIGPTKVVEGSRVSWERGIAECQFLVLDYIRDLLAAGHSSGRATVETDSMTIDDIEQNITNLLINRKRLVTEIGSINPMLAEQVDQGIDTIGQFTTEVFHRGRMGAQRFRKEPDAARRAIRRVETLLIHAASLAEARDDQAEIPVLELE